MPENNFNKIFSEKFENYEPAPQNNRWNNIETALNNKKKKRGGLWLFFALSFITMAVSALVYLNLYNNTPTANKVLSEKNYTDERSSETNELNRTSISESANNEDPSNPFKDNKSSAFGQNPVNSNLEKINTQNISGTLNKPSTPETKENPLKEESLALSADNTTDEEIVVSGNEVSSESVEQTIPEETQIAKTEDKDEPIKESATKPKANNSAKKEIEEYPVLNRLSISVGAGGGAFRHQIKLPTTAGSYTGVTSEMVKGNYRLRKDMEKMGYYSTEMISIGIRLNDNFRIGSGIHLLQITQRMKFTAVQAQQDAVVGPTQFKEGTYSSTRNDSYQFPTDSITAGNTTTADNKYYYREIPLYIQGNFKINEHWNFTSFLGGSYRYLSSAVAYLPDVDNVGMVYFTSKKDYPGIKGTWNLFAAAGLEYRFNEAYGLDAMLTYNHGLQSTIGFEHFVRQYQRNLGLNIRLTRYFSFD